MAAVITDCFIFFFLSFVTVSASLTLLTGFIKPLNKSMKLSSSETSTKFHYNKSFSLILLTNETSGSKSDDSKIHRNIRNVVANRKYIWDYGVIPYEVDKEFAPKLRQMFIKAMQHWEQDTCLKFVEYDSKEHTNYIYFTKTDNGCSSEIGKRGISRQSILISPDCENFGNILHELGHALGFFHEHARPDRDDYIVVHYDNIERGKEINFHKQLENDSDSSGLPYDFESITHYSKRAFSKNHHQETLKPIVKVEVDIGQRLRLSQGDIKKANLLYKCLECGQTLYLPKGDILSPHYQGLKIAALEGKVHSYNLIYEVCEWHIRAGNGERIALQINDVSLHYSLNCSEDYIEIRDGYWHRSPLLKRLCGNHTIIKLESQSKHMLIKYVNRNAAKGYYGFKANYQFLFDSIIKLNDSWHLDFISHSAHLTDKPYTWYIMAPEGYQVALKFEFFDLGNNECDLDYLEIRNGNNSASRILAKICSEPDNVVSTTNEMFLKFVSESSIDDLGFSAIFMVEVDECKLGTHNCQQKCRNTLGSYRCTCLPDYTLLTDGRSCVKNPCSSVINATVDDGKGTFGLTSFPNDINLPGKCIWKLIAPDKHTLFLRFTQFELVCDESDYLVIYSQLKNKLLKKIGEFYCHEFPPFVKSLENILRLELNLGEEAYQRTKLKAEYKIDNDECIIENGGCEHICQNTFGSFECLCRDGFSLQGNGRNCTETECKFNVTNPYGKISSFNYPTNYTSNTYCYWRFQTVLGHRIRLKFLEFDLEYHQECIYDNVTIYDGRSRASSSLGIYCGKLDANHEVLATTNNMLMIFRTDANVQATGFIARHLTECGSYLKSKNHPQILFSHPSYGTRSYRYNMFCDWQITTDSDKSIEIKFLDFELEYDESCKSDYLEIKEESIGFHKNYGRFCGNNKPPNIKSCSDMISLRFITNELFNLNGFKIEFKTIEAQECTEETIDEINY